MTTYSTDPALYIFTSLTAGSSHIVTATSRLETILRANRVPFKAVDIATDQKARMLWGRRAGKDEGGRVRKLPGLVQEGLILGDIVEIEDWNEYGELKQHVKIYYDEFTIPNIHHKHPEPLLKKRPVKKSAAAATPAAGASASATAAIPAAPAASAAAIPTPPPLPEPKAATTSDNKATTSAKATADKPKPEEKALPIRSVADEAAAKAKELRLKSLREKVHGKEGAAEIERQKKAEAEGKPAESAAPVAAAAAAVTPVKKAEEDDDDSDETSEEESSEEDSEEDSSDEEEDEKTKANLPAKTVAAAPVAPTTPKTAEAAPSIVSSASSSSESESESESDSEVVIPSTKPPGLQSMSGTWRHGSQQDDPARETLQSPTSGKWGQGATVGETTTLHGAELRTASEAEIKAIECETVIKEEPELEEEEEKEKEEKKKDEANEKKGEVEETKEDEDEEKKDKA